MAPIFSLTASAVALVLLGTGVAFRRTPSRHVPLMLTAFGLDMVTLVVVEVSRHAVEQMFRGPGLLLSVHIALSVVVLVLYPLLIWSGRKLLRGVGNRVLHRRLAIAFLSARTAQFGTAIFVATDVV